MPFTLGQPRTLVWMDAAFSLQANGSGDSKCLRRTQGSTRCINVALLKKHRMRRAAFLRCFLQDSREGFESRLERSLSEELMASIRRLLLC